MNVVDMHGTGKIFRSARPTKADDLIGIKSDFNLETGFFEWFHEEVSEEQHWCRIAEATYIHRPMSDFPFPLKPEPIRALVKEICMAASFGNVLVHCLHGEDRTGIVVAAYRILIQGWSVNQATAEMYKFGFHRFPYGLWVKVLGELK